MVRTERICDYCKKPIDGEYFRINIAFAEDIGRGISREMHCVDMLPEELHLHSDCMDSLVNFDDVLRGVQNEQ